MREDLYVCSNRKGRGVYALRPFRHGEVVEDCPVLVLRRRDCQGLIESYWWAWSGRYGLALSVASLFNHAKRPNTGSRRFFRQQRMVFTALRDIEVGEEITVSYGKDFDDGEHFKVLPPEPMGEV